MTSLEILELLCQRFRRAFFMFEQRRRPLKIGIIDDILAVLGGQVDRAQLSRLSNVRARNSCPTGATISQRSSGVQLTVDVGGSWIIPLT
jgi:sRNA-binding protein